jgi:anti-sigma factor RsiW
MMQPYIDGMLSDAEVAEAREHLEACPPCEKRYRFEERLRHFVRVSTDEPMSDGLRERLASLRSS